MKTQVLVVDDNRDIADTLCVILKSAGYECLATYSGEEAAGSLVFAKPDLVIADVVMPGMSGIELCIQLHATNPSLPVILLSGNAATEELLQHGRAHMGDAVVVMAKPCPPRELLRAVQEMTKYKLPKAI